ncbi:hypothetical protein BFP97_04675 [Roseivirga sp. 4D4]|uniref:sensor histidine kinase n=1 Tax=Roseivirga sp. 4D4 TaxID=1889784 RepID=UPI000853CB5D|nr:ATP-binding protein [Roseivirga sp. 4D4]OEK00846.1 hypothetical protein BFP97_04675 [Roseivirga sp. 4D4]
MIFSKGFLMVLIRVLLIVAFSIGMVYTYLETELSITPYMFAVLILIVSIELTWRQQSQERNWASFLESVRYGDFNRTYEKKTQSKKLQEAYQLITERMESLHTDREAEFRLLQTVLRHVSVAVICYRENGEVVFTNKTFNTLLELVSLTHIDRLAEDYPNIHQAMTSETISSSEWIDHKNGQKLLLKSEAFKLKGKAYTLVSLTDIRSSLETKELESYQKLMRVMTHEIMNSTTPILSLIRVVNKKLIKEDELVNLGPKDQKNVATSLEAIEERTSGMLKFVEAYKQINRSIEPHLETVESKVLIDSIAPLIASTSAIGIRTNDQYKGTLEVDRALMAQVLINLLKNAMDAVGGLEDPMVSLKIYAESDHVVIQVEDNGPGVSEQSISEIFVPFYTTKKDGSGIGLALSRKIIKAHKGNLEYARDDGRSQFTILLSHQISLF